MFNRRNALLGWIVWRRTKRRMKSAVPRWPRAHPIATIAGLSAALAGLGVVALLGGDRSVARLLDDRA